MDFPKQPWLDGFRAGGLRFEDIDYVFCTHLHIDHCGWNTLLRNGRWVPTFPKAKYAGRKRLSAETIHPETSGGLTVSRWSRPVRRCWSTMTFNLTTRFGSPPRRATRPAIAALISVRAVSVPSSSATSCTMRYSVESLIGLRSLIGTDQAARSRRRFLGEIAGTGAFVMPVHFPHPTAGLVEADGDRFHYKFVR